MLELLYVQQLENKYLKLYTYYLYALYDASGSSLKNKYCFNSFSWQLAINLKVCFSIFKIVLLKKSLKINTKLS